MKHIATLVVCVLLLAPMSQASSAAGGAPGTVVLTADMVQDAVDIEAAINEATHYGTRPGTVILDGRGGPFIYSPDALDVDVNIFVSDLTLRGAYQARLQGGGITFDGMPLSNITIENLWVQCPADCITSSGGAHRNVTVRDNRIEAPNFGIAVGAEGPGAYGWLIEKNRITAGNLAVLLLFTTNIKVVNNQLSDAAWGIVLEGTAQENQIIANSIFNVREGGIALRPDTLENKVHANRVSCVPGVTECVVVYDEGTDNLIQGNR
jgi:parallel beta-helix repeat protein